MMLKKLQRHFFSKRRASVAAILTMVAVCSFSIPAAANDTPPIEDVVLRLQRLYDNTQDLSAGFIQETTVKSVRKTDIEKGRVYFKTPRRMLWDYTWPKTKKLIVNAQTAWLYLPDEKLAYRQDADRLFQSATLIKFLSGIGKLTDDFDLTFDAPDATDTRGNYVLRLSPKQNSASYQSLRLVVDRSSFHILQVSFDDVLGNTTVLKFLDIRLNTKVKTTIFQFKPPADVSIFDMP